MITESVDLTKEQQFHQLHTAFLISTAFAKKFTKVHNKLIFISG